MKKIIAAVLAAMFAGMAVQAVAGDKPTAEKKEAKKDAKK